MSIEPVVPLPAPEQAAADADLGLSPEAAVLRTKVLDHLRGQGFQIAGDRLLGPVDDDKDRLRRLHADAVATLRAGSASTLRHLDERFVHRLAQGDALDPAAVRPALVPVTDRRAFDGLLWRWLSLHWSIPVSSGYGRRLRFLVVDDGHHGKVIGLIGLADPVFALGARDAWVGWDAPTRGQRLANVMDAFVLGAVPPYSGLLGGKLVALLATSTEVRDAFAARYGHRETLISQRDPDARLALVTTTSALGRSSVYNRLTGPDGRLAFQSVGYTVGSGDFHLAGSIYAELAAFAAVNNPTGKTQVHERWRTGGGRNRRETIQIALDALGLPSRQLRLHGIRRQVFVAPLMANAREYLTGQADPGWSARPVCELADHWRTRWALPRADRDDSWRAFDRDSWLLYTGDTDA